MTHHAHLLLCQCAELGRNLTTSLGLSADRATAFRAAAGLCRALVNAPATLTWHFGEEKMLVHSRSRMRLVSAFARQIPFYARSLPRTRRVFSQPSAPHSVFRSLPRLFDLNILMCLVRSRCIYWSCLSNARLHAAGRSETTLLDATRQVKLRWQVLALPSFRKSARGTPHATQPHQERQVASKKTRLQMQA